MTDIFEMGHGWWAISAYAFLVVISHIAWWSRKAYFPNQDFCGAVHRRIHLSENVKKNEPDEARAAQESRFWHRIGIALISAVPPELEISGFFATLFWPAIVLLNLFLLAQVLGVVVGEGSGGGTWEIYPFGTYSAIPLLTAALYSLTQTAFGIIYGEAVDKKKKYLFLFLLMLAVLAEGGLAVYRAWLIQTGGEKAGSNLVDTTLGGRFGLVLGAFLGVVIPISHSALGYVAYPKFLVPIVRYALRLSGGLSMLLWSAGNYLAFGWHPIHPDDWYDIPREERARWEEQQRLMGGGTALAADLKLLHEDLPATPGTVAKLIDGARELRAKWTDLSKKANAVLADAQTLTPAGCATQQATGSAAPRLDDCFQLAHTHDHLVKVIAFLREAEVELEQEGKPQGETLLKRLETCRADLGKLQHRLEAMQDKATMGMDPEGLLEGLNSGLESLRKDFAAIPVPAPGSFRFQDYQKLSPLVRHCEASFARLSAKWRADRPTIPPKEELNARRDELNAIADLTSVYSNASKSLFESKQIARERLRRVERKPGWLYWLMDRVA